VANAGDGTVSIVDPDAKTVTATLKIPTRSANRLKFTLDGKMALIADLGSGDVVFVDRSTRAEVKRINIGRGAAGILMDPNGKRAFVASPGSGKIAVVDLNVMAVTAEIAVGRGPDGMAWVPAR
jgi:YVTN family beta-propeller protein